MKEIDAVTYHPTQLIDVGDLKNLGNVLGNLSEFESEYVNADSELVIQVASAVIEQLGVPASMVRSSKFWQRVRQEVRE